MHCLCTEYFSFEATQRQKDETLGAAACIPTACVTAPGMSDTCPDGFGMAVAQTLLSADNENSAQI